jgi:hypothetical protein
MSGVPGDPPAGDPNAEDPATRSRMERIRAGQASVLTRVERTRKRLDEARPDRR